MHGERRLPVVERLDSNMHRGVVDSLYENFRQLKLGGFEVYAAFQAKSEKFKMLSLPTLLVEKPKFQALLFELAFSLELQAIRGISSNASLFRFEFLL
jgi:hypothetical protein